jgi:hypothetical protein
MALSQDTKSNIVTTLVMVGFVAFIIGVVFVVRLFGAATVQDRVVAPRPGIECLVVSASDGVGVSCYQIPEQ